jgi:hypothetical protein
MSRNPMGKVFVDVGMSLDGFIAGPNGRPGNPLGDGGTRIHKWLYPLATFLERMGTTGPWMTGPWSLPRWLLLPR